MQDTQIQSKRQSSYSWSYNTNGLVSDDVSEEVKLTTIDHRFDVFIRRAGDFWKFALCPHNQSASDQDITCTDPIDAAASLKELGYRDAERMINFGLTFIKA